MSKVEQNNTDYQERVKAAKVARDEAQNNLALAKNEYYSTNYEYSSLYTKYQEAISNERWKYASEQEWEGAKTDVSSNFAQKFGLGKMSKSKFNTGLNFDIALDGARRSNEWLAKLNNLSIFDK